MRGGKLLWDQKSLAPTGADKGALEAGLWGIGHPTMATSRGFAAVRTLGHRRLLRASYLEAR